MGKLLHRRLLCSEGAQSPLEKRKHLADSTPQAFLISISPAFLSHMTVHHDRAPCPRGIGGTSLPIRLTPLIRVQHHDVCGIGP